MGWLVSVSFSSHCVLHRSNHLVKRAAHTSTCGDAHILVHTNMKLLLCVTVTDGELDCSALSPHLISEIISLWLSIIIIAHKILSFHKFVTSVSCINSVKWWIVLIDDALWCAFWKWSRTSCITDIYRPYISERFGPLVIKIGTNKSLSCKAALRLTNREYFPFSNGWRHISLPHVNIYNSS